MFLTLILKYWKGLLLFVVLSTLAISGYSWIYNRGVEKTTIKYEEKFKEYNEKLEQRINNIELMSSVLIEQSNKNSKVLSQDLYRIRNAIKDKPLFTVVDGKCEPSPSFIETYNSLIKRGNTK